MASWKSNASDTIAILMSEPLMDVPYGWIPLKVHVGVFKERTCGAKQLKLFPKPRHLPKKKSFEVIPDTRNLYKCTYTSAGTEQTRKGRPLEFSIRQVPGEATLLMSAIVLRNSAAAWLYCFRLSFGSGLLSRAAIKPSFPDFRI